MPDEFAPHSSGIVIGPLSRSAALAAGDQLVTLLTELGLSPAHCALNTHRYRERRFELSIRLKPDAFAAWTPGFDTLELAQRLRDQDRDDGRAESKRSLDREIVIALLASPVTVSFPSFDELVSALRMRVNVCRAAAKTAMDFHTAKVDRPASEWDYDEDRGFTLRESRDLIDALRLTTQPDVSGKLYAFSCYRATEYIVLLAMAEEMRLCHPGLLKALEAQWRQEAIASGRFHDTFLHELGSNDAPLPLRYYVPGDRVWFRNPDEASADASGYEGSWTMYMGGGLFTNMWQRNRPFTLLSKCIEIFHWRDAVFKDEQGDARIDENIVEREVKATLQDPQRTSEIVERMLRLRDLKGTYEEGGCIDRTREGPRWVRPGTTDIPLHPMIDELARPVRRTRPTVSESGTQHRPPPASPVARGLRVN